MEANVPKSDDVTSAESNEGKTKESTTKSEAATTLGEQTDDEESDGVQVDVSSDVVTDVDSAIDSESKTTIPPNNEGSVITFRGVETGQATLSVEAMDADIPLGSSAAYDLAPYTSQLLNAMDRDSNVYTMDMQVAILPSGGGSGTQDDTTLAPEAVCTVTLRLEYCPSPKDKREELYELLDKAGEKKSAAVEMLRQAAMAAARTRSSATDQTGVVSKPAVKPGFLNKKEKPKEISSVVAFYERNLGPNSPLRRLLPVAKNYILFFGFIALSHFKGQFLGLPKPV